MGAAESTAQTEGQIDGRPAVLNYKRDDDGAIFSWTEGYKAYPDSKWTHVSERNILATAPVQDPSAKGDYHFLSVEENQVAQEDKTAAPVLFRANIVSNPPLDWAQDLALPSGASCWEFRQDRAQVHANFHVIVSTKSGTGLATVVWQHLVKPMLDYLKVEQGRDYALHFTSSESSVTELTQNVILPQANMSVRQAIILMSGDGGLMDLINALLSQPRSQNYKKPSVAILPLGTGNALAHSAGVASDNTMGLKSWFRGTPKEVPLFAATFSPGARILFDEARQERPVPTTDGVPTAHGAVVCSWGFHASLVADSDTTEYRKFGAERFKMAGKEALFPEDGSPPHAYKGNVSVLRSGESQWQSIRQGEHLYVLATPLCTLEKGFTISPASRPLDGKLRLVHFGPLSGEATMEIMTKAYSGGQHIEDENVGYEEIDGLRIEFGEEDGRWRRVCLDGKIIRVEQGGWMEVRPARQGVIDLIVE